MSVKLRALKLLEDSRVLRNLNVVITIYLLTQTSS